ncbi:hypothetical protein PVAND_017713 [Polypedilum vanderplanki]|uniref:Uncharacterized protein n=1 Tax=Polypedilum vanderplanki TaxID=319348 RepID=A0A9J6B8X1_POLVA|nr:hypothetical protein PVAND_017713 [Polypedilum vanderplanki]
MHKKFVERRAYHEFNLREKFFNDNKNEPSTAPIVTSDEFKVKKCELEDELIRLDYERKELEEELRNIQSLQHFKRIYNEWQDKVLERNERKLQKTLKITSINEITRDELQPLFRERAASERIIKLNDEFLERVKERQKRLSLPLDDNLDASTESLLNDDDDHNVGGARKKKKKFFHFDNKENFPAHFREFIEYCEQEIEISKNSVESGESLLKNPLFIGLIGVSMCICGFYIGKHFITKNSNFS